MSIVGAEVRAKWRAIGLGLGVKEHDLDAIQENNKGGIDPAMSSMMQVFQKWRDGMTSEYSWKKLAEVLCSPLVDGRRILEEMHTKLTKMYTSSSEQ